MATAKVHFNQELTSTIVELNRVARTCGAITGHATPQLMVRETGGHLSRELP